LNSGGKTRPWRSRFSSIVTSFDALRPLLRDKKREDLIVNIDVALAEEVLEILQKAEAMFDILEYSYIVTLQLVLPVYSETCLFRSPMGHNFLTLLSRWLH